MLRLRKGQTEIITLTLNEKKVLPAPDFRFVFVNGVTGETVEFVLDNYADDSLYPTRCNLFEIAVNDYFLSAEQGFWSYRVYEDGESGVLLETGKMKLLPAIDLVIPAYQADTQPYTTHHAE